MLPLGSRFLYRWPGLRSQRCLRFQPCLRSLKCLLASAFVLSVALLLAACATQAPRTPVDQSIAQAVAVPAVWQNNPAAAASGLLLDTAALPNWWTRFNDPVLSELVTRALSSSPDLRSALARIAEYRARRGVERAGLFPVLDAAVSGGRAHTKNNDTHLTTTGDTYTAALDASWQVDLFGRQRQLLAAASADLAQNEQYYYGAQVTLAAAVASAYVALRSAETQLVVVQRSLGTRSETARLTRWQEQAGTGSALDTQQALATLEAARASIPALQLTVTQTRNLLARLCGQTPGALDALLAPAHDVPAPPPDLALGIPADMLRQRPDVHAAELGIVAAFARTTAARRARLPALTLSGSIGIEALSAGRLFDPTSTIVSILGGLTAPLFDAGRITQTVKIQRALEQQALATYTSTALIALGEVENALAAVQRNTERLTLLTLATTAAREAQTLSALQYQAGQIDLLVSLDTQRTLLDLEQQEVTTSANQATAYVQLYQALGGGWIPL